MPDVRTNHVNAYQSTLAAQVGPTDMTATVTAVGSLAAPCYLVFEPDSSSQREYFTVSAINGNILTISARYRAGSAAGSGLTHAAGAVVRMVADAAMFEDLHDRIDADATAFDSHHGGTSTLDHPEATTGTRGFMSSADKTNVDAFATAHRNQGGTEHAAATTSVAGFLSAADKTLLDDLQLHADRHASGGADPITGYVQTKVARTTSNLTFDSTTPANITGLSFAVGANEVWAVEMQVFVSATLAGSRLAYSATGPSGATFNANPLPGYAYESGYLFQVELNHELFTDNIKLPVVVASSLHSSVHIRGVVVVAGTAGTVQMRAALVTPDGATHTIAPNTYLIATRIA